MCFFNHNPLTTLPERAGTLNKSPPNIYIYIPEHVVFQIKLQAIPAPLPHNAAYSRRKNQVTRYER